MKKSRKQIVIIQLSYRMLSLKSHFYIDVLC